MQLSIIIPMYRVEHYIERCLKSIANQDISGGAECLIIDDCSPDNSRLIAEKFIEQYNGTVQFRILSYSNNRGASYARNFGIKNASGKYMMFVDSDDYLNPYPLQMLIDRMETENLDFIGFNMSLVKNGETIQPERFRLKPRNKTISNVAYLSNYYPEISPCNHIVKRDKVNTLFFSENTLHEDYAYMLQLYCLVNKMAFSDCNVYVYDIKNDGTVSTTKTESACRKNIEDWVKELDMLRKSLSANLLDKELYKGVMKCLIDYQYVALTYLLRAALPFEEKLKYLNLYNSLPGLFKYGKNHLNANRKLRYFLYCIPGIYPLLLRLTAKK